MFRLFGIIQPFLCCEILIGIYLFILYFVSQSLIFTIRYNSLKNVIQYIFHQSVLKSQKQSISEMSLKNVQYSYIKLNLPIASLASCVIIENNHTPLLVINFFPVLYYRCEAWIDLLKPYQTSGQIFYEHQMTRLTFGSLQS